MAIPYKSVRANTNLRCGACNAYIGDGDMYLLDEELQKKGIKDAILCHFCNYKRSKEKKNETVDVPKTGGNAKDFKDKVSRLDDLIAKAIDKDTQNQS